MGSPTREPERVRRAVPGWLMDLMVCPGCGASMRAAPGGLACAAGHAVDVVHGIPRFTPPSTYADSFGFEWTTFPRLQFDAEGQRGSEDTFRVKTGLTPEAVRGRTVLDAGCGMGRFSDVVARWGAERVVAVDISRAVDAAAENLDRHRSVAVLQADLRRLPLPRASFDIVFSIGVLHHTPSTFESLAKIARLVKPGGLLAIWVYSRHLRWRLIGGEILRPFTSRMDADTLLMRARWVVPRVTALKRRFPTTAFLFDFIVPTSNHPDPQWRILDTFDWYSPRYQWKHSFHEVEGWFRQLGFVNMERQSVPVSVRGWRPANPG